MQEVVVTIEDGGVINAKVPDGILLRIIDRDWPEDDLITVDVDGHPAIVTEYDSDHPMGKLKE